MEAEKVRPDAVSTTRQPRWRRRLAVVQRRGMLVTLVEITTVVAALAIFAASWAFVSRSGTPERLLTPLVVAVLLVANLVPAIGLLVLMARRIARHRAARAGAGSSGRLHVRLGALFST